eukprot:CAMPEP_0117575634 /NCGR_PEP_ID=MMETSP0784-20121206/62318_1 /TAXON_ID=39447 /ORGANISM="" /LENGTH=42 /DNA_ID= /DNA_START= /DNA_END= /DNA_ORIENTATION=
MTQQLTMSGIDFDLMNCLTSSLHHRGDRYEGEPYRQGNLLAP